MSTMYLPPAVRECLDALETAGYPTYAVGGCVRDSLLGLTPNDYDLCTDALPEHYYDIQNDNMVPQTLHPTVSQIYHRH